MSNFQQSLEVAIKKVLEEEIKSIAEKEISAAQQRISVQIRDRVAKIVIASMQNYEAMRDGKNLIITIRNVL
jgi:hypothetical protein